MDASSPSNGHDASRPLVAHVVFRFDYGGLENGLVNLINRMPPEACRHAVIALTECTEFAGRLERPDVSVHSLGKRPGKDPAAYVRLFRLLRELRPAILHTRNIGTLDCAPIARLAGVGVCVHGEHGWDTHDPEGKNPKYRRLRRLVNPLVRRFITVSEELREWLADTVGIDAAKIVRICNGVDTERFSPRGADSRHPEVRRHLPDDAVIVGSVLRFNEIKDPMNLVEAFIGAKSREDSAGPPLCLLMVGDGPLREAAAARLAEAGVADCAWLPGSRDDVPELLRAMDLFVLGSRREGISNTLLEAMASGLPLIATDTGGNRELVAPGRNGLLVPPGDSAALGEAIRRVATKGDLRRQMAESARADAVGGFSLDGMVENYWRVYQDALAS